MPADAYTGQLVGFLHGLADGLADNQHSELARLSVAPAVQDLPTFSDLGDSLVSFQGGVIILRGFGCGRCGHAHWAEDDPARRRPAGAVIACTRCSELAKLPEVDRAD
jgi:hypothetical protein